MNLLGTVITLLLKLPLGMEVAVTVPHTSASKAMSVLPPWHIWH